MEAVRTHFRSIRWFAPAALALLPAAASAQWATFVNETTSRLQASSSVGANDPMEKDYGWGDLDKDGDVDVVCVRKVGWTFAGSAPNVLFMNEGKKEGHALDGVLVDRTAALIPGFLDSTEDRDVAVVDVDGDSWLDIVTCTATNKSGIKAITHPRVYINRGLDGQGNWLGFVFDDVNRIPTFASLPAFCGVGAGDIDNDGDVDLYFADYASVEDRLLLNNGSGYFTDVTTQRMSPTMYQSSFGSAAQIVDLNGDRAADVLKGQNGSFSISYNNPAQIGYFNKYQNPSSGAPYFVASGDLNNDGRWDLAQADDGTDKYLLNGGNNPDGTVKWTTFTFSGDDGFGENVHFHDLNNDGFNDVLITDVDVDIGGCGRRMHIYRNLGNVPNVTLQEQGTLGIGNANLMGTHDVAVLDINQDGWLDLVIGRCSSTAIWMQVPPAGLQFTYPQGLPAFITPEQVFKFQVKVAGIGTAQPAAGTGKLYMRTTGGTFSPVNMVHLGNNLYEGTLPAMTCSSRVEFYVTANAVGGALYSDPPTAPTEFYTAVSAVGTEIWLRDDIEGDVTSWTVTSDAGLATGEWEQAIPNGTIVPPNLAAPDQDATNGDGVKAFVTENGPPGGAASANDVDGGNTYLVSPKLDLAGTDGWISYARWFFCDDVGNSQADYLTIEISNNDGQSWVPLETVATTESSWQTVSFLVSNYVAPTGNVRIRFQTGDNPNNSTTEAGVDNFQLTRIVCGACKGDIDGDGKTCQTDLGVLLASYGLCEGQPGYLPAANLVATGQSATCIDQQDLGVLLGNYGCGGCP